MKKLAKKLDELEKLAAGSGAPLSEEISRLREAIARAQAEMGAKAEAGRAAATADRLTAGKEKDSADTWKTIELARHADRPGTLDYVNMIFDEWMELHGDRRFGDDKALAVGIGLLSGRAVTFMGHVKGKNLKDNISRNYGMAHPEGYRKALRAAKQAEKFGRPIVTFIDTPGAYPGTESEERGIGEAIAFNLREFSSIKTPIICFVIGEGGSGGALGIGVGDKLYMLENAVYSVISPEGCASILLRDPTKAREAAAMLKITARDLVRFKVANGLIPEPEGGAHMDPKATAEAIKAVMVRDLDDLCSRSPALLVSYRRRKIAAIGAYSG